MNKKKTNISAKQKIAFDFSNLMLDRSSVIYCDKCKEKLGVLRTLRCALFKKQGSIYHVPCKACGYFNERKKGSYKQDVNKYWKEFQAELDERDK